MRPLGERLHWTPELELDELVVAVAERCAKLPDPGPALAVAAGGHALAYRGELGRGQGTCPGGAVIGRDATGTVPGLPCPGVATFYAGEHGESARWWREIAAMEDLPLAYRAEGHIALALLACYHSVLPAAWQEAAVALASAGAAGAADAVAAADRAGAGHVSQVARLAQLADLVRLARHDDALDLVIPLLHDEHRAGAWPQLWITMRIVAELLSARGHAQDAEFLLAAAGIAESAPPVTGDDVRRYGQLTSDLRKRLGSELTAGSPRSPEAFCVPRFSTGP